MVKQLVILQVLILGGLCSVFLLPETPPIKKSATDLELPRILVASGWKGGDKIPPSEKELQTLADDTNFARRNYTRAARYGGPGEVEMVQASIVLSGKDLNNSIHRPERCLPAQGLNLVSEKCQVRHVPLPDGRLLPVMKLYCTKTDPETQRSMVHLNYYWFTGHDTVTASHYARTLQDMKDRLLNGYDQQWAYITVSTNLMEANFEDEHGNRYRLRKMTEEEADEMIGEFIQEIAPQIISLADIKNWK